VCVDCLTVQANSGDGADTVRARTKLEKNQPVSSKCDAELSELLGFNVVAGHTHHFAPSNCRCSSLN
jgi:hypothetical protein